MDVFTPFDAAFKELVRAWKVRDDLRRVPDPDDGAIRAAFVDLDRARAVVRRLMADHGWRWEHEADPRTWIAEQGRQRIRQVSQGLHGFGTGGVARQIDGIIARARETYFELCLNLDPAANTMNPAAEAAMSTGIGTRPSLGHPGDKYETGLEALEELEVIAVHLACQVFGARFAEVRVPSGAIANLYGFMATTKPGDAVIVPPASLGGHVTHHTAGAAGLYGLQVHQAPADAARHTIDVDGLARMARDLKPKLITVGGSLNLGHHPVADVRAIADEVGARVMFDGAHLSGLIAGGAWPNPLREGAHLLTMSTYKSLAGPPGGLVVTDDELLAQHIDQIAHPGLTANFDLGKTAALSITLLDWIEVGAAHARAMVDGARLLHQALATLDLPVVAPPGGEVVGHQLAMDATRLGGGAAAAGHLRKANLLTSAIGLPHIQPVADGGPAGLRLGTNELVRFGVEGQALLQVASFIDQAWNASDPSHVASRVARFRREFTTVGYIR